MTAISERRRILVGGQWTTPVSSGLLGVVDPATEELLASAPDCGAADVDAAVAAARAAFDSGVWSDRPVAERLEVLAPLAGSYAAGVDDLSRLVTAEMGSPATFSSLAQAAAPAHMVTTLLELAAQHPWEERRPSATGGTTVVRRVPVGVVAAITPWNIPQVVIVAKVLPALVAGCSVVLKPAPETPFDAYWFVELLEDLGLPSGVVNLVPGGPDTGRALAVHPGVDKIAFTGSTAAGREIALACAPRFARVSLELGGKSAAVVLDDADPARTAAGLRFASFLNSGQACAAQTRVLVPRSRRSEFVDALVAEVESLVVGDPTDPVTEVGPMVTSRQRDRVAGYVELGLAEGARVVAGGPGRPDGPERGWFVRPTLFDGVDPGMRVAREEIFGPVLCVLDYDTVDDAVRIANDSPYGLAGSVWTADRARGLEVAGRVRAGTLGVNHYGADFASPFGGFKASGLGREYGPEGLDEFVEFQSIGLLG